MLLLATIPAMAAENGLLGKRYVGLGYLSGEVEGVNDRSSELGLKVNVPINKNLDLSAFYGSAKLSTELSEYDEDDELVSYDADLKESSFGLAATYHFAPEKNLDPFVKLALSSVDSTFEIDGKEISSDTTSVTSFSLGLEYVTQSKIIIIPNYSYYSFDGDNTSDLNLNLGYWVTKKIYPNLNLNYNLDDEELTAYGASVVVAF